VTVILTIWLHLARSRGDDEISFDPFGEHVDDNIGINEYFHAGLGHSADAAREDVGGDEDVKPLDCGDCAPVIF
jgi:hypothetical protein